MNTLLLPEVAHLLNYIQDVGRGRGVVRLLLDRDGEWKAYTLLTVSRSKETQVVSNSNLKWLPTQLAEEYLLM